MMECQGMQARQNGLLLNFFTKLVWFWGKNLQTNFKLSNAIDVIDRQILRERNSHSRRCNVANRTVSRDEPSGATCC